MSREAPYCEKVRSKYIDADGNVVVVPACGPENDSDSSTEDAQTQPVPATVTTTQETVPLVPAPEPAKPPRPRDECWDDKTSGDCTLNDAEIINDKQRSIVTRVDGVGDAQDETARNGLGINGNGMEQYLNFWRGIAQGDEALGNLLAISAPLIVGGLIVTALVLLRRR